MYIFVFLVSQNENVSKTKQNFWKKYSMHINSLFETKQNGIKRQIHVLWIGDLFFPISGWGKSVKKNIYKGDKNSVICFNCWPKY